MNTNTDALTLATNHALNDYRMARSRMALLGPGMGLDEKRRETAYCEFGWPERIEFSDLYSLYRRGGVAFGAVEKIVSNCWKTAPWIIEGDDQDNAKDETPWERSNNPLFRGGRLWRSFAEADRRRLVGRYSGLLIQLRDSGRWDEPVKRKGAAVVKLIPAWAGSLKPATINDNPQDEGYGQVTKWQYTEASASGASGRQIDIHPDRVFILGDWQSDAIGFLEPAFNNFVNLEKVEGGSGESFLKNAARQLSVNFDKEVDLARIASMYGVSVEELQQKFNDAAREVNRANDLLLITQGATTTPLVAPVSDPTPTYNINIQTVAAALDIPSKVLVGNQTGERASSEDLKSFNARCQSRRNGDLAFDIHDFVAHLTRIGVIKPISEYTVMWDDLTEPTSADKLTNAKTMAEINSASLATGQIVFEPDEIREAAGYDPLEGGEPLPDVEDNDDGEERDPTGESA